MGNKATLQLLKDTDNSQVQAERGRKGGYATAKKMAKRMPYYNKKKCKNCKLPCPLIDKGKEENWKCRVPDAKRMILEAAFDPDMLTDSIIGDIMEMQTLAKTVKEKDRVVARKIDLKKELYPNVQEHRVEQRSINLSFSELEEIYNKYT